MRQPDAETLAMKLATSFPRSQISATAWTARSPA